MLMTLLALVVICVATSTKAGRAEASQAIAKHNLALWIIAIGLWAALLGPVIWERFMR